MKAKLLVLDAVAMLAVTAAASAARLDERIVRLSPEEAAALAESGGDSY